MVYLSSLSQPTWLVASGSANASTFQKAAVMLPTTPTSYSHFQPDMGHFFDPKADPPVIADRKESTSVERWDRGPHTM